MSAGSVRAGSAFVEIGADPRKFFAALNRINKAMANMGRSMAGAGAKIGGIGVATLAPFAAAVRQGTAYQSTLLNIQASTGATAQELDRLKAASMQMSQAMGVGPTQIAGSFLELLKAGMSVEQVLGGAGQAAIEFATVGQMDVAAAGVVMADAMNVFGVSAGVAANAISSAADASSTSIEGMSQAFSQVSAVAALANQSIGDTSAALAILANAGVKGSDAGTSLKTMLLRLMAPADEAVGALASIGLSVSSFRNADGSMKPLVEIIRTLNGAMGDLGREAQDDIFKNIFGQDAIRAAAILTGTGVDGFNAMTGAMDAAMPVGEKFKVMMSGLAGAAGNILAALQRFAIAVSDAVGPALMSLATPITGLINGLTDFATKNKEAVATIAKFGVSAVAIGGALTGLGLSLQAASFGFGGILKAVGSLGAVVGLVLSPMGLLVGGVAAIVMLGPQLKGAFSGALDGVAEMAGAAGDSFRAVAADGMVFFSDLATTATTTFDGIYAALSAGDLAGAMDVLWAGLMAGWLRGVEGLMSYVDPWVAMFQNTFTILGAEIYKAWDTTWVTVGNAFRTFGAYLQGVFDNIVNGVLSQWDNLEAGIIKSWNYIQSFFKKGFDLKKENEKVDSEMSARRRQRELDRPGIAGRTAEAERQNEQDRKDLADRKKSVDENTQATADARDAANQQRAGERRAATQGAEANLADATSGVTERSRDAATAAELMKALGSATSLEEITNIGASIDALLERGNVGSELEAKLLDSYYAAFSRINVATASASSADKAKQAEQGAGAAGVGGPSQGDVAGTFSSVALGGMGIGSSLAQKQLDTLKQIEQNTSQNNAAEVAA
jgi:TP901 family phage tail tape measure protein